MMETIQTRSTPSTKKVSERSSALSLTHTHTLTHKAPQRQFDSAS